MWSALKELFFKSKRKYVSLEYFCLRTSEYRAFFEKCEGYDYVVFKNGCAWGCKLPDYAYSDRIQLLVPEERLIIYEDL